MFVELDTYDTISLKQLKTKISAIFDATKNFEELEKLLDHIDAYLGVEQARALRIAEIKKCSSK